MSAAFTPGPWSVHESGHIYDEALRLVAVVQHSIGAEDRARLIAAAPDLLAEVEREYTELADHRNEWPGRSTHAGQAKLCRLRDLICEATGREPQDVQDDYGNRLWIADRAKATGTP